jgi:hypothetical protein
MAWYESERKVKNFVSNLLLLAVVLVAWFYTIYAGTVVSQRYLYKLDLSDYYMDQRVPKFWRTTKDNTE